MLRWMRAMRRCRRRPTRTQAQLKRGSSEGACRPPAVRYIHANAVDRDLSAFRGWPVNRSGSIESKVLYGERTIRIRLRTMHSLPDGRERRQQWLAAPKVCKGPLELSSERQR